MLMVFKKLALLLLLATLFIAIHSENCQPFGVRTFFGKMYFGNDSPELLQMRFNTPDSCVDSFVQYNQSSVAKTAICLSDKIQVKNATTFVTYVHTCSLEGTFESILNYQVFGVAADKTRSPYSNSPKSINMVDPTKSTKNQFIVLADWSSIKKKKYIPLHDSFQNLIDNNRTQIHGIMLQGDIGYDLDTNQCQNYVDFLNMVAQVGEVWPIMLTTGNHEYNTQGNWALFTKSFEVYNITSRLYQTFLFKHLTVLTFDPNRQIYGEATQAQTDEYSKKLGTQLAAYKKNYRTPWVITASHYPLFCSYKSSNCSNNNVTLSKFFDIFNEQGVDFYIGAHSHTYERLYPYFKGNVTPVEGPYTNIDSIVTVVEGVAGNDKDIVEDTYALKYFTAKATFNETGYGILAVHNESMMEYLHYSTKNGTHVADRVVLYKSSRQEEEEECGSWCKLRRMFTSSTQKLLTSQ